VYFVRRKDNGKMKCKKQENYDKKEILGQGNEK
jgi:hypothetical protein